jgi:glycosyltransferase involved in cell wall biosynthesis
VKVAFVVPRYGVEVRAGAEGAARLLAEHIVSDLGWEAEALTTCAVDIRTWADEYAPGSVDVNGVEVHRFRSRSGRHPDFDKLSETMMFVPRRATASDQERWIDQQGPVSPDLIDAVATTDADVVVFTPYLYHPTVRGIERVGRRAVLHPAAHEEPPLHLPLFRRVFGAAAGLAYYTLSEQRLVERTFAVASSRHVVLGLGIDDEVPDGVNPIDGPYLLYVGRVDDGKGTRLLTELFGAYKRRRPGPLRLVLAGSVLDRPPAHRDVVLTGEVDEATKWALYRGALGFVMPSAYESFSLVLMEAWECGVPALVNGASEVLREHCERSSGGGLWFDSYATFEAALDRLQRDGDLRVAMGAAGRRYVEEHYRWPALVARYRGFLEGVAERAH